MAARKFSARPPAADPDVIELLEKTLASAKAGYVRAIAVVAVNPVNQVEIRSVGDLTDIRIVALQGGLVRAALELMNRK